MIRNKNKTKTSSNDMDSAIKLLDRLQHDQEWFSTQRERYCRLCHDPRLNRYVRLKSNQKVIIYVRLEDGPASGTYINLEEDLDLMVYSLLQVDLHPKICDADLIKYLVARIRKFLQVGADNDGSDDGGNGDVTTSAFFRLRHPAHASSDADTAQDDDAAERIADEFGALLMMIVKDILKKITKEQRRRQLLEEAEAYKRKVAELYTKAQKDSDEIVRIIEEEEKYRKQAKLVRNRSEALQELSELYRLMAIALTGRTYSDKDGKKHRVPGMKLDELDLAYYKNGEYLRTSEFQRQLPPDEQKGWVPLREIMARLSSAFKAYDDAAAKRRHAEFKILKGEIDRKVAEINRLNGEADEQSELDVSR